MLQKQGFFSTLFLYRTQVTVIFSSILIEKTNSIQVAFYASLQSYKEENLIASSEFEAKYYDKINPLGQVA